MMSKTDGRGFTLIELLVVISINALLISILLPALQRARVQARRIVCAAQLHSIGTAIHAYGADYDDELPYRRIPPGISRYAQLKMPLLLYEDLVTELIGRGAAPKAWVCPSFLHQETYEALGTDANGDSFIGRTPYAHGYGMWWMGYSLLFNLNNLPGGGPDPIPSAANDFYDSKAVLAADFIKRSGGVWDQWSGFLSAHHPNGYLPEGGYSLFVDGHVNWFVQDELGPKDAKGLDQLLGNFNMYGTGNQAFFWGVE